MARIHLIPMMIKSHLFRLIRIRSKVCSSYLSGLMGNVVRTLH